MKGPLSHAGAATGEAAASLLFDYARAAWLRCSQQCIRRSVSVISKLCWQEGVVSAADITPGRVEQYLARLVRSGACHKTARNHLAAISTFCRWLVAQNQVSRNPCDGIIIRPDPCRIPNCLSADEVRDTLAAARQCGVWPEVCLALATGLRLGELQRLRWGDINLTLRILRVAESKSRRPRSIPLNQAALAAIAFQRNISGDLAQVFPARRTHRGGSRLIDQPRSVPSWTRCLAGVKAAVPAFDRLPGRSTGRGWHLFRHTFASRLAEAGCSPYRIAQWLGHSDVRTTEIYVHLHRGYHVDIEAALPWPPEPNQES